MVKREIYSVGLKRKVKADVEEIIATPSRNGGFRYQVVGFFTDSDGKQHRCQSLIGKDDAQSVAAKLGQSLPTAELKEVESFAAEDTQVEELELLVPEPSSSPNGNGRVLGQHTGGQIVSATDASQSLPAHDYIFIGRAEGQGPNMDALNAGIEAGEEDMVICEGCEQARHSDSEFSIDNARSDVLDDGNVFCDYCWETQDAEFVEVVESVSDVWSDEADGSETFVVEEDLKDYLIEVFYEEIFSELFIVSSHDGSSEEWEITFPYALSEEVIDAIADYQQNYQVSDREMDDELADWVRAEEFNARGMNDSDDLFEDKGISKSTAAIATALLALGAAYWWSQRK